MDRLRQAQDDALTRVDVRVLLHVGFLVESFTAVLTWIGTRV